MKPWHDAASRKDRPCQDGRGRRRAPPALLLVLLSLGAVQAQATCDIEQLEIPVRIVDQRPVTTVGLNGVEVPMLVDSGAFFSFLSPSTATELKLPLRPLPEGMQVNGYTGFVSTRKTRVEKVRLLGAELRNIEFVVGGNELGAGIGGILGRNFLTVADTEYDLAHGAVRLSLPRGDCDKTNFAHWAGDAPVIRVPLDERQPRDDDAIHVNVLVNGKRTLTLMDTGAPMTSLTLQAARSAGIDERDLVPFGRAGGLGTGRVKSWIGPVALFELGGERITHSHLRIDDADRLDEGMVLGLDYFLSHRIYVSRQQRQVYVTWNGGSVFALHRGEQAQHDSRYAALPQDIADDDVDALARRGAGALAAGNHERALEDLNRVCERAPGVAQHFDTRAQIHLAMRQPRAALADLDEALRLDPAATEARFRRARLRARLDDRAGVQADLAVLDADLPPSSALRAQMGRLHAGLLQVPEALRQFDLWLSTHPKDARIADVLNSRCWLRARRNVDVPLALQDCKDAVDRDDDSAAYRDSLGWTYLRLGDATRAKKAFDGALRLGELPSSLYGRALAALRLGDAASGERDLAAARKLDPRIDEQVREAGFEFADAWLRTANPGS